MINRVIVLLLALLTCACAQHMSQEEFSQIKKVAIVNGVKNELTFYNRGQTLFGDALATADIGEWQLSEYISEKTELAAEKINPSAQFDNIKVDQSKLTEKDPLPDDIVSQLKADGYDTTLVISNAGIYTTAKGGYYLAPPSTGGFIFYTTSLIGTTWHNQLFPQFTYTLYRLSDSKQLSQTSNKTTYPEKINTISVKPFEQYSTQEHAFIKETFINNIDAVLEDNLVKLFKNQ